MRKNWLAAAWARRFRAEPLVPDAAFQDSTEPYPGHWRRFPEPWPTVEADAAQDWTAKLRAALDAALAGLPDLWRRVITAHDVEHRDEQRVADDLDLTGGQDRDILARARAAVRDELDHAQTDAQTDRPR
jgi:RNA polymerase sigma-70 factor (ECF subfamily)